MSPDKTEPEKLNLESTGIAEENRARLKEMFPSAFTETVDKEGNPVESIDFEKLKAELGTFSDIYEGRRDRYGMDWPGKKDCLKLIQQPSVATLKPCREESVDFDDTENLFIEGDNLEVLKLLQKSYYGKVKMIYIDPPYNTGKEFIYPDKYSESLETYLAYAGLVDDEGKKFATNTAAEGRFHTKWLNMMYPRLYLARNLLREDGVIFISIDDNELNNLLRICGGIFGEENRVATIIWKKSYGGGSKTNQVVMHHEYIIMFAKNKEELGVIELPPNKDTLKYYKYKDEKEEDRGPYRTQPLATKSMDDRPKLRYPIIWRDNEIWPAKQWQWSKERVEKALKNNELVFTENDQNGWTVDYKQYLKDENGKVRGAKLYSIQEGPYTQSGTSEIEDIFGNGKVFKFPKPSTLISKLVSIDDMEGIVLDFFSGSCASAHAVLDLNINNNGNRKFIMVQLPEPCDENSEAYKAGYKTIADIGKERIRRVIAKIKEEQETKELGDDAGLFDGQEEKPDLDLGFKVFKLDRSNFQIWDSPDPDATEEDIKEQLELYVDHIDPEASQEDILFEILLKSGFKPTEKVERIELAGKTVFSIAEGALLICLEDEITRELINAVAEAEPMRFICLDKGFKGNDQLKANAVQTFAARNQGRDKAEQIVFRTV